MQKTERIETSFGTFLSFQGDLITKQLQRFGAHQRNELAMLLDFVRAGDVIIDVGANIGTFAIPLASKIGALGRLFAFEGDDEIFEVFLENIELNECSDVIEPLCAIVTSRKGSHKKIRKPGNLGATKFMLDSSGINTKLKTLSLDSWYRANDLKTNRIDIMKIDVEGMEADVLFSCKSLVDEYRPIIYIEIANKALKKYGSSRQDIQCLLDSSGYHYFRNIGKRHSTNDRYVIGKLPNLKTGGNFFDLLAVHPSSDRYPSHWKSENYMKFWYVKETIKMPTRAFRFLYRNLSKRLRVLLLV